MAQRKIMYGLFCNVVTGGNPSKSVTRGNKRVDLKNGNTPGDLFICNIRNDIRDTQNHVINMNNTILFFFG